MSAFTDRVYQDWLAQHRRDDALVQGFVLRGVMAKREAEREAEREAWLRDALRLRSPRGPERSVGRGRSAPAKRGPN